MLTIKNIDIYERKREDGKKIKGDRWYNDDQ